MKIDDLYNPIQGFDYKLLNDPEFLEDAVREEIISPIIKALGYSASSKNKIIRSRKLIHPFVSIGSVRKEIFIIPDYLMEIDGRCGWICEAKKPTESIIKNAHVEQAYSYAVHSEVLAKYFVLCNGKEFALYAIGNSNMLRMHIDIKLIPNYWLDIKKMLEPANVFNFNYKINKDLGLHLKRLGFSKYDSIIFPKILPAYFARMDDKLFTFSSTTTLERDEKYVATFDFDLETAHQLNGLIPQDAYEKLLKPLNGNINQIILAGIKLYIDVSAVVGEKMEENEDEIFLPFKVVKFLNL